MNSSVFDPETFMNDEATGSLDTRITPCPEGDFPAIIENFKVSQQKGRDGDPVYPMEITWSITDDNVKKALDRPTVTVRQSIWLDLNEFGKIDMGKGKNVGLGKVRAALGQNNPDVAWSPNHLKGAGPALITVGHRSDKNDPDIKYADVKKVGQLPI